jgi:hypothetical protein
MAWTIRLEDEDGKPIDDEYLVVEFHCLPAGDGFPICTLIEAAPYYDTLLNPVQIDRLVAELKAGSDASSCDLSHLLDLARRSSDDVHIYLRFTGD